VSGQLYDVELDGTHAAYLLFWCYTPKQ